MDRIGAIPLLGKLRNLWRSFSGQNRDHDLAIFKKLNAIANEPKIDDILNGRIFTSDLRLEDVRVIEDLIMGLRRIENQCLDATIQLRSGELAWEMDRLMSFVARTFFPMPGPRLQFRPHTINRDVYHAEWVELNERLQKAWKTYKDYRRAVKTYLMV